MMSLVGFFFIILSQTASKKRTEACPLTLFSHHKVPLLALQVNSLDGASHIGSIIRKWNGFLSTMGNADHFEIRFPLDLDVKMKAMIFGTCFLIVSLLLWAWEHHFIWWEAVFYRRKFILKLGQLLSVPLLGAGLALGDGVYRFVARRKILSSQSDWSELSKGFWGHIWRVSDRGYSSHGFLLSFSLIQNSCPVILSIVK